MSRDYKIFFAICKAVGIDKNEAVLEFTDGRTDSLTALDDGEYKELMIRLRKLQPTPRNWEPKPGDAQRKKMIGIARSMQWDVPTPNPSPKERGTAVLLARLDEWCIKTFGQKMNDLDLVTLGKAVTIFESKVYTGYLKGIKK